PKPQSESMMKQSLPAEIAGEVSAAIQDWTYSGRVARLWARDKTLWTGADEDKWLGWLDVADRQLEQRSRFAEIANQVRSAGYADAVLLGMGGSSLCPEVLSITFGGQDGFPNLHVLD